MSSLDQLAGECQRMRHRLDVRLDGAKGLYGWKLTVTLRDGTVLGSAVASDQHVAARVLLEQLEPVNAELDLARMRALRLLASEHRVLPVVRRHGAAVSAGDLAALLSTSVSWARRRAHQLADAGKLTRVRQGRRVLFGIPGA